MAHELEILENGQASLAYTDDGDTPWHGLGTRIQEGATPQEMMKAAGLDWTVEKRENFFVGTDGDTRRTGNFSLVRSTDNKVLTWVGSGWNPVQNHQAFEFFDEFCKTGDMTMHTAGSLYDGRRIWALAKVSSDFTVFGDDKVEGFLLFSNPHMFGHCVDVRFTPIRVVCNNTLTLSLNSESNNFAKVNHRGEFDADAVKNILGLASNQMQEYKEVAETLGSKQITDAKFKEFLGKVFGEHKDPKKMVRNAELAYSVFETQPGANFAQGSYWQALNAVTYVTDHKVGRNNNNRLNNIWFGGGRKQKINAVKTALEMATA